MKDMWHTNVKMIEADGTIATVPTRTYYVGKGEAGAVAEFAEAQHIQAVAAHELGHFLVNWKQGAFMREIRITEPKEGLIPKGSVHFTYPGTTPLRAELVGGAAGERACDRWLREESLWNPPRGIYAELQGRTDRASALKMDPTITFDGGPSDYRHLQDEADRILNETWHLLRRGLRFYTRYATYAGDDMCELLRIPNNPEPA